MTIQTSKTSRRAFLFGMAQSGIIWGFSRITGHAWAMGSKKYPQGIREIKGDVTINGAKAVEGMLIQTGDVIVTGADGSVIFVIEKDVFSLREHTRLEFSESLLKEEEGRLVRILRIVNGKMLGVFGKGRKQI